MRIVHFAQSSGQFLVTPVCGVWGPTDTGWTDEGMAVTCEACREVMAVRAAPAPGAAEGKAGRSP